MSCESSHSGVGSVVPVVSQTFLVDWSPIPDVFGSTMRCTQFQLESVEVSLPVLSIVSSFSFSNKLKHYSGQVVSIIPF